MAAPAEQQPGQGPVAGRAAWLRARGAILCARPGQPPAGGDFDVVEAFMDWLGGMRACETGRQPAAPQACLDGGHDPRWLNATPRAMTGLRRAATDAAGWRCEACGLWSFPVERDGPSMYSQACVQQPGRAASTEGK